MPELIKIAIVGPESTGKSYLAKQLAAYYRSPWVPEYARTYLDKLERDYKAQDVEQIAEQQIRLEEEVAAETEKLLICDTNLLVIKVWMEFKYGHCPEWILNEIALREYHLHLLTDIDLPWEPDPLRENPNERKQLFEIYENELRQMGSNYILISGDADQRFATASQAIEGLLSS